MKHQDILYSEISFKNLVNDKCHEIILTSGIGDLVNSEETKKELIKTIKKYFNCEWELSLEDQEFNTNAFLTGGSVFSLYKINNININIITDKGWNRTTVMLSEEY